MKTCYWFQDDETTPHEWSGPWSHWSVPLYVLHDLNPQAEHEVTFATPAYDYVEVRYRVSDTEPWRQGIIVAKPAEDE